MERVSARRIVGGGSEMKRGGTTPERITHADASLLGHTVDSEGEAKVTGWLWDHRGGGGGVGFRLPCISALFSLLTSPHGGGGKRNVCENTPLRQT